MPHQQNRHIVVIDDNVDAANTLSWLFELEGFDTRTAYSAIAGLEIVSTFKPGAIFCDLGMPAMSGYDFARTIRSQYPEYRPLLVSISGWNDESTKQRTRIAGFDVHLVKPADCSLIFKLLDEHFKKLAS